MRLDSFNKFYDLAERVPILIKLMSEDDFNTFPMASAEPLIIDEQELDGIKKCISDRYSIQLHSLKFEFIKELELNNISTSNDNQLKSYLNLLLNKLDPIRFGLYEGSFIKEGLGFGYNSIPLSLVFNDGSGNQHSAKKREVFELLGLAFKEIYHSYRVILEVEFEIKSVLIERGLATEKELFGIDDGLSAFEIALKHWYLENAKEETSIPAVQVGEKYKHLRNAKNIQQEYLAISNKRKSANRKHLQNIHGHLSEYPDVQKAITNDMDMLE